MSSQVLKRNVKNSSQHSIGIQTEILPRDYLAPKILSSFYNESEGFPQFLYKSHTITQMGFLLLAIYILACCFEASTMEQSVIRGYFFACLTLMVYGMIYFPNTLLQRPHPSFWRLVQSFGVCYLMSIVFCLFMSREQLLTFFKTFIDEELGKPLPEKTFAADCRIFTPEHPESKFANIANAFDVFIPAHICGWAVKMFILRDFNLAMIQQITFEFLEITFRHWLPNFWECWWDHIILDILICNTGGIIFAQWLMKKYQMREYKWSMNFTRQQTFFQNFRWLIFKPYLEKHEWKLFSSTKRFLSVIWFIIFMNLTDLSYFFNKYILWIKPNHNIMKVRTFGVGFLAISAAREYYVYITDENVKRMGPNCWIMTMIVLSEWLLFMKNYNGSFVEPFPFYVKAIWFCIFSAFFSILAFLIKKDMKKCKSKQNLDSDSDN